MSIFRSFKNANYRIWFIGAFISDTGTWMQRIAQDWIIYDSLTKHDAAAMGIVISLQFIPQIILTPFTGVFTDRFNRRNILLLTQTFMSLLSLTLGIMVLNNIVKLWHVYFFAFAFGIVAAFDIPTKHALVSNLVKDDYISNAVGLNNASFNLARMIGPACSGFLIVRYGPGLVFIVNTLTFIFMLLSLVALKNIPTMKISSQRQSYKSNFIDGLLYIKNRLDITLILLLVFIIGTFGLNFGIYIATMAKIEFNKEADSFGVLSSIMALGSVLGSLWSAKSKNVYLKNIFISASLFGLFCLISAISPTYLSFSLSLIPVGFSALYMITSVSTYIQKTTIKIMRGRVTAVYMAFFLGGTPFGAPIMGWASNTFGPRLLLYIAASSGFIATIIVAIIYFFQKNKFNY